jgi:hypothetical protein
MSGRARFLFVFLALVTLASSLVAADFRIWNPKDGLSVRQGYHIEWFRSIDTDANGNICVIWTDTRLSDRDIWAQLIAADGTLLWGEDGKLIVSEYSRQEDPHVFPDGNGNWIITWIDYRYDFDYDEVGDIYMQKIDSNGDPMWSPSTGVIVCDAVGSQMWAQSFSDGDGGAVTIWVDNREGQDDIYAQHVDANGNMIWEENGKKVAGGLGNQGSTASANYTADTDGNGGIIFAWTDDRNPTDKNLYANRVANDGTLAWADSSGMPLCVTPTLQKSVRLCPDGNNGAFFVWEDSRNMDVSNIDIYGQHINTDGDLSWTVDGVQVTDVENVQQSLRIVNTNPNEAVLIWEDKRVDGESTDLYSQKITDNNGSLQLHWGPTGNESHGNLICDAEGNQNQARLSGDMNGGVYLSWVDERWGTDADIELFGQHLDADGNRDWGDPNGIIISDQDEVQNGNIIRPFNNNTAGYIWADYRFGSPALYFQIFNINGTEQLEEDGELLVYGMDNIADFPTIIPSNGDINFTVWTDGRYGNYGTMPYMQRINASTGQVLEDEGGIPLIPGSPFGTSDTLAIDVKKLKSVSDGNGGMFSVWIDNRWGEDNHVYIQKVDADGNILWGDRGTPVAYEDTDAFDQKAPHVVPMDDGGAIVIYNQNDADYYVNLRAQRLDSNGQGQWTSEDGSGYQINTDNSDYSILAVEQFNDGSILVVYKADFEFDLYAQRILLTGENAWDTPIALCNEIELQDLATTMRLGDDILVVWEDQRRGAPILDIYAQRISADGTLSYTDNGLLLVEDANQQVSMALQLQGNYYWMAWEDRRDGSDFDVYLQKYDFDGTPQFTPANGILIGEDTHNQSAPEILVDEDDGIYIVWAESADNNLTDIRYLHLDSDGQKISEDYPDMGLPLTLAFHNQSRPAVVSDGESGFFSVWQDDRSTGKEVISNIYMQRVNDWIVSVNNTPDIQPDGWALENAYPNPFNPSTRIAFKVGVTSNVKLTVYDILGREVVKLVDGKREVGNHIVTWNGKNAAGQMVSSGTYFYRLEADDAMMTKSMILLK